MNITNSSTKGLIYKTLFAALSAIAIILNKQFLKSVGAFQLLFIAYLSGFVFISLFIKIFRKKSLWNLIKDINLQYLLRSSLNVMGRSFWLFGLITIDTTIAATLTYLRPIFTVLIAVFFLNETITPRIIAGILLSIIGTAFVTIPVMTEFNITHTLGIIIIIFAQLIMACQDIIIKKQSKKDDWDKQAYNSFLLSSLLMCPLALIDWKPFNFNITSAYLILMGLTYAAMEISLANALKRISLVLAAPIDFVRIVFTAILAYIFFTEKITLTTSIGCILIITAILIIFTKSNKKNISEMEIEEPN